MQTHADWIQREMEMKRMEISNKEVHDIRYLNGAGELSAFGQSCFK